MWDELSIVNAIRTLAKARGWSLTYAAKLVSGSGDTVERLEGGMSLTIRRAHAILTKLDRFWPDDLPWPDDIPRPRNEEAA